MSLIICTDSVHQAQSDAGRTECMTLVVSCGFNIPRRSMSSILPHDDLTGLTIGMSFAELSLVESLMVSFVILRLAGLSHISYRQSRKHGKFRKTDSLFP